MGSTVTRGAKRYTQSVILARPNIAKQLFSLFAEFFDGGESHIIRHKFLCNNVRITKRPR
jgi:hypothetical protein